MAGNILTPLSIWNDFYIDVKIESDIISSACEGGITLNRFYIGGRKTPDGQVKIYAVSAKKDGLKECPAIVVFPDFNSEIDEKQLICLAQKGYYAVAVDLSGKRENAEAFTVYPEYISYANYSVAKSVMYTVADDVKSTCWYEWDCVGKYILEYVKNIPFVTTIGGMGIGQAASVLWHVAANENLFSGAVFAYNAGWEAYRGRRKTEIPRVSDVSDEMLKYLAGIEPEAYAVHVHCPVYLLSSTNSKKFDADRAADTLSRIKDGVYCALDYSINYSDYAEKSSFDNILLFLEEVLRSGGRKISLPVYPQIKCGINGDKVSVFTAASPKNLKSLSLYAAEQISEPALRTYIKCAEVPPENTRGEASFEYLPFYDSDTVYFFTQAEYDNGYTVCSAICSLKLPDDGIKTCHRSKVIFSGRDAFSGSAFSALPLAGGLPFDFSGEVKTELKAGPMGIRGITSKTGMVTLKVNADKDKPANDAILLFDAYVKEDAELTVSLITDYLSDAPVEYSYTALLGGGEIWHNLKLELSRFKTHESKILKTYVGVNAVKISANKEFIVNNLLWL